MSICKHCGTQNENDYKFCTTCGEPCEEVLLCKKCKNELLIDQAFCPFCGTKQADEKIVNMCQICNLELNDSYVFCPNCGGKATGTRKEKSHKGIGIFNLIAKILVASISLVLIFVVLFTPVHKTSITDDVFSDFGLPKGNIYVNQTGINLIGSSFIAMREYSEEEAFEDYLERMEKVEDKYSNIDEEDITSKMVQDVINRLRLYELSLIDSGENVDVNNNFLQIQICINALVVVGVLILLVIATVFSILAIFNKKYSYKNLLKLYITSLSLLLLFFGVLRIQGFEGFDTSSPGFATIFGTIMLLVILCLICVYEMLNRNVKFNLVKVISKGIATIILLVSIFVLNGVFLNSTVKNSKIDVVLKPNVQTLVQSFDLVLDYNLYVENNEEWLYKTDEMQTLFASASKKYDIYYENLLNRLIVSDKVLMATYVPELTLVIYLTYIFGGISLIIALAVVVNSIFKDNHKIYELVPIIITLVFMVLSIVLAGIIVSEINLIVSFVKMSINATPIVFSVFLLGCLIYLPILNAKIKKSL